MYNIANIVFSLFNEQLFDIIIYYLVVLVIFYTKDKLSLAKKM